MAASIQLGRAEGGLLGPTRTLLIQRVPTRHCVFLYPCTLDSHQNVKHLVTAEPHGPLIEESRV